MVADIDLLVVQQHAVDRLDGGVSGIGSFVVNETVALGTAMLIGGDLAREDVAEGSERVVQSLVISLLAENVLRDLRSEFKIFCQVVLGT